MVDVSRAVFNQVDANHDGTIDRSEFNRWASGGLGGGVSSYEYSSGYGGGYGGGYGAAYGAGYGGALAGLSGYESSVAYGSGGYGAGLVGGGAWESSAGWAGAAGAGAAGLAYGAGSTVVDNSALWSSSAAAATYPTDAQGLYIDSNPQVIRRPAATGVQTYTQNIAVRFLQPPPVPPHGPLIIREVRPVQPPVPPPLRIRQQAPPLPTPPPLVLRERPPVAPVPLATQTVIRRLPALPVPPRSVIIERLPPLPPRPRDIVIERWVPYGALAKRRTLVQRAPPAVPYPRPRNVIVQYEPAQARIVRQFQRLGVVQANPSAYVQTYGASLLDAGSLLSSARAAGVVEDISPPAPAVVGYSAAAYGQDLGVLGAGAAWDGSYGYASGYGLGGGVSSWEGDYGYSGYGGGYGGYGWGGYGLGLGGGWESSASSWESSGWNGGVDVANAAFNSADVNHDGRLDRAEFNRFVAGGL